MSLEDAGAPAVMLNAAEQVEIREVGPGAPEPEPAAEVLEIHGAALHTLDHRGQGLVLSEQLLELSPEIVSLFRDYLLRAFRSQQGRMARFKEHSAVRDIAYAVMGGARDLLPGSQAIARSLYGIMETAGAAVGEFAVVYAVDQASSQEMIALLKLDLRHGIRRDVAEDDGRPVIRLIPVPDLLPEPERRIQKCAFIPAPPHPLPYDLLILDSQSARSGDSLPADFFTTTFLGAELIDGPRERTRRLAEETERWLQEEEAPPGLAIEAHEAVIKAIHEPEVDLDQLAAQLYSDREQQTRFLNHLEGAGFEDRTFAPDQETADRLSSRLTYVLDGGIRISGDAEAIAILLEIDPDPTAAGKTRITIESARFERKY